MKSYELLIEGVLQQMLPVDEQNKKAKVKPKTSHV